MYSMCDRFVKRFFAQAKSKIYSFLFLRYSPLTIRPLLHFDAIVLLFFYNFIVISIQAKIIIYYLCR